MDKIFILGAYAFIGLLMVIFNKYVTKITYNLVLYFTEKMDLSHVFIFKVDDTNRDSMFLLTRTFTVSFGLVIFIVCTYLMFF